jgi:hypothetical protein
MQSCLMQMCEKTLWAVLCPVMCLMVCRSSNTNRSAVEQWSGWSLSGNRCLSMRDRTIRTRQAGSVVGSVCAGPSLLATYPLRLNVLFSPIFWNFISYVTKKGFLMLSFPPMWLKKGFWCCLFLTLWITSKPLVEKSFVPFFSWIQLKITNVILCQNNHVL